MSEINKNTNICLTPEAKRENFFKYSSEKINNLIKQYDLSPVTMKGVKEDLERIKPVIEDIYNKHIFYLSYWKADCGYFGWDWVRDNDRLTNMAEITDGITDRFLEIYALILSGLGETIDEQLNIIQKK